jgi:hypothetical protein
MSLTDVRAAAALSAHSCLVWQTLAPPNRDPVVSSRLQITALGSVRDAAWGVAEEAGGAEGSSTARAWPEPKTAPAASAAARIRIMGEISLLEVMVG